MLVRMTMWFGAFRPVVRMPVMLIMHMLVLMAFVFVRVLEHDRVSARPGTGRDDRNQ